MAGIFGIVSQVVAARSYEFGIRAALGAVPRQLVALSLRAGVAQAALALTRTMTALLHGGAAHGARGPGERAARGVTRASSLSFLASTTGAAILDAAPTATRDPGGIP